MRLPSGFKPAKESFETRTLIGRMWKRSNALSWPILIAREAWSYNLGTWYQENSGCSKAAINASYLMLDGPWAWLYFFQFVKAGHCLRYTAAFRAQHIGWWEHPSAHRLCLAAIAIWTHPFPSRTGPWNGSAPMIVYFSYAKVGHRQASYSGPHMVSTKALSYEGFLFLCLPCLPYLIHSMK